jgi:hypothetical protein
MKPQVAGISATAAEAQLGASALTEPTMAMSKASISTPAMITIRIEQSMALSALRRPFD